MTLSRFVRFVPLLGLLLTAGCSYVEVAPVSDSDRILVGTVSFVPAESVPAGAILSVRVVDVSNPANGPVLLGQQRIEISGPPPFEFRTEYRADDDRMRRGVNVEAKILVNGKLRYGNLTAYLVTLSRASASQEIMVFPSSP